MYVAKVTYMAMYNLAHHFYKAKWLKMVRSAFPNG